jgi:hypothetical protein
MSNLARGAGLPIIIAVIFIAACASRAPDRGSTDAGLYRGEQKVGEILATPAIGGQIYAIYRVNEPAKIGVDRLGVPDAEIPPELMQPSFQYTLSKDDNAIRISGTFPSRLSADLRKSTTLIPRRHVERLLNSSEKTLTFRITDP